MKKCFYCLIWLLSIFYVVGCARSPAYKQDQNYYKGDNQAYYGGAGGKSPTHRIESMGQPKKRVMVLNFWNDTPIKQGDIGLFAADELKRRIHQTQRLIIPADLKTEFGTQDFVHGDKVKVAQLIREGRRMGVAVLVIGRITKIVFRQRGDEVGLLRQKQSLAAVDVEIKLFDVSGGREIMAAGKSGESSSNTMVAFESNNLESKEYRAELTKLAVRNAVGMLVPDVIKAVEKMSWSGHVAKIVGQKVYVNAGKVSGLISGDILKVLSPGDDIYDPATGAYLGRSE
ncbi:MAG: hypothetical protein A3K03_10490, partial [Bdellovibrionales bacterium RIFOXYD1_FULL_44_7]